MRSIFAGIVLTAAMISAHGAAYSFQMTPDTQVVGVDTIPRTEIKRSPFPIVGRLAPALNPTHWLNSPNSELEKFGDGHVYLLDFTAMICDFCKATYPVLDTVVKRYASQGIRMIYVTALYGVSEDGIRLLKPESELAALSKYFAKHNVMERVAIYDNVRTLVKDWRDSVPGTITMPKVIVIDGRGVVRGIIVNRDAKFTSQQVFAVLATLLPPPVRQK